VTTNAFADDAIWPATPGDIAALAGIKTPAFPADRRCFRYLLMQANGVATTGWTSYGFAGRWCHNRRAGKLCPKQSS
jgi:hypothetical protein